MQNPHSIRYTGAGLPAVPMVFFEIHGRCVDREAEVLTEVFERHGARRTDKSEDDAEVAELWRARREVGQALMEYDPDRVLDVVGDVTVPLGSYREVIRFIGEVGEEYGLPIPAFGHAGDGNVHYAILVNRDDPEEVERAHEAAATIVRGALDLGGTCTGEHGVGVGKRGYLADEYDPAVLSTMRDVKDAFDPNGILNPGKIFE